jgi:hypothetical protein
MALKNLVQVYIGFLLLCTGGPCKGEEVYIEPDLFIVESFPDTPEQAMIWLTRELKEDLAVILGHPWKGLRIRYWRSGQRTAWILDEIGKVELITAGFVVENDSLERMEVLVYRESHGWEIRYPFFNRQFMGAQLDRNLRLDKNIDGISGATLSVDAVVRLSRMALYLHGKVVE